MNKSQKKILFRIVLSAIIIVLINLFKLPDIPKFMFFMTAYLIVGYDVLINGIRCIISFSPLDENFLMAVATLGAIILGEYTESAAVMIFYQTGELFQSYAVGKSRRAISELMDIRPDYANIENENGEPQKVSPENVNIGDVITILPGEKVPIDGILIKGNTLFDTSVLTGESIPRELVEGDEVLSGFINISGVIKVKTTKEFSESAASKILELVENASMRKSKSEKFISKFAFVYTPVVCVSALLLMFLPPIIWGGDFKIWFYRALTFLVMSCPCALVISIPLTFFAGIGGASRRGILIKGANFIETLSKVKYVIFDKTGTMTKGNFKVSGIHHNQMEEEKLLEVAAHAECYSHHPIAVSLKQAFNGKVDENRCQNVKEISGFGISAQVDGKHVLIGNSKLMEQMNVDYIKCSSSAAVVHIAIDGEYAGHILITDEIKSTAKSAIKLLKKEGIKKTIMLTGDNEAIAGQVAKTIGIDKVFARLLPQDKVEITENIIINNPPHEKTAFVGDGINDAPVITRADVGIAMGGLGSDAAVEAADVVLMDDNPEKIAHAINISRKCIRIVYENIVFAVGIKFICLILAAVGIANMWTAVFADVGVMVIAVLNAIRALKEN